MKNNNLKNVSYMMKLVVKSACGKAYLAGAIFDGFVMGIAGTVPVISVSLIYRLIEEESSFRSVIYWAAAMLAFVLLSRWWMHWYSNVYKPEKSAELRYHLNKALYEKSLTLDVASYYDPDQHIRKRMSFPCDSGRVDLLERHSAYDFACLNVDYFSHDRPDFICGCNCYQCTAYSFAEKTKRHERRTPE